MATINSAPGAPVTRSGGGGSSSFNSPALISGKAMMHPRGTGGFPLTVSMFDQAERTRQRQVAAGKLRDKPR